MTVESVKENEIVDKTTSLMESAISNIESINAGNGGTSGSTGEPDEDGDDENPPPVEEPEVGIDFGEMTEEEIDLSKVNIGATGDGESETPYSINAK